MSEFINVASSEMLAMFGLPGHWEILLIVLVILLLFGGKKLPELARGLGRGMRSFKQELQGMKTDVANIDAGVKDIGKDAGQMAESQTSGGKSEQQGQA